MIGVANFAFSKIIKESDAPADYPTVEHSYERINIIGETSNKGNFDPTVEYNSDGTVGYLIYSGLEQPEKDVSFHNIKYIHTHLAKTNNNGKTWQFVKRITESTSDTVESPIFTKVYKLKNNIQGMWHHEVPTLIHDPDDPGKEWKLFWHKYFSADMPKGTKRPRILSHSWIMLKEAGSPEELANAEEIKLFGTETAVSPAKFNFQNIIGKTSNLSTYSEPASLYYNKKIYVVLSYFGTPFRHELVLISSRDHGKTWEYIGSPLDDKDTKYLNKDYKSFWGVALAEEGEKVFLLAPPIHKKHKKYSYQGTFIFEFEDIDSAKLKRDSKGNLIVIKYIKRNLSGNINSGQSDYHKHNTYGGIIFPQADLDSAPAVAQIFNTKEKIIDEK